MKRMLCAVLTAALLWMPLKAGAVPPEELGKSICLMEASTGTVLMEHNSHEKLAPASVTKIMTMLLIMEAVDSGQIRLDDPVTASETAAAKGGSQVYLKAGEIMSVSDMLKSIAVSSANDCACAMAEHLAGSESAFVEKMNAKAQELGMKDTHFVNCTGLDDGENASEHRTTAYDIALMSRELLVKHPGIKKFTTIWMDSIRNGTFGLSNTNKLIRFYPGATGLKTGFTSGAGYCLSATADKEGMELIAVMMGSETSAKRNAACKSMLDYGYANYALFSPEISETTEVPVVLGTSETVSLIPAEPVSMLVEKAQKASVTWKISAEPSVSAPVSKGQKLGNLRILCGDQVLSEIPMLAQEAVGRLTWGQLFGRVLRQVAMAKQVSG